MWPLYCVVCGDFEDFHSSLVCGALKFKTDVLWVQQDALYHAYVNGHVPPGAFMPKDFNDRYIEDK